MSRTRLIFSLVVLLTLGGLCIYANRDLFSKRPIHIYHRISPRAPSAPGLRSAAPGSSAPVIFGFDRKYSLTSVKVVAVAEALTNKYAHPVWELASESNSVPISSFVYGAPIRGMHPKARGARPAPLEPGMKYRLVVKTGAMEAAHDFNIPIPPAS